MKFLVFHFDDNNKTVSKEAELNAAGFYLTNGTDRNALHTMEYIKLKSTSVSRAVEGAESCTIICRIE